MIFFLAFAAAAAAQATPTDSDIACITAGVTPQARTHIVEEAQGGTGGPVREAIEAAAVACGADRGWDEERTRVSAMASAAILLIDEGGRRLEQGGVPVAIIDRWFAGESAEVRTEPDLSDATIERLIAALRSAGMSEAGVEAQAAGIGVYVGALIALAELRAGAAD